jgi:hypothetical protein
MGLPSRSSSTRWPGHSRPGTTGPDVASTSHCHCTMGRRDAASAASAWLRTSPAVPQSDEPETRDSTSGHGSRRRQSERSSERWQSVAWSCPAPVA